MSKPSYSKFGPGNRILCLDFETSGSTFQGYEDTFKEYQGISFGAVIADAETFEPISTLYREIKFNDKKYKWSEDAEKIHGLTREHLEQHGVPADVAAVDLAEFIFNTWNTQRVMFLGHNPWFDIEAMKQLLEPFDVMPELYHVVLDTSAAAFMTTGLYRSNDVFEFFTGRTREAHNALEDALITVEVARNIRLLMNSALGK